MKFNRILPLGLLVLAASPAFAQPRPPQPLPSERFPPQQQAGQQPQEPAQQAPEEAQPQREEGSAQQAGEAQPAQPVPAQAPEQQQAPGAAGQQAPGAAPQQQAPEPQQQQAPAAGETVTFRNFRNASLLEVVDLLARTLGINYILDPGVSDGQVTINTYGRLRRGDLFPLLQTILRMNGAAIVQVDDLYHIVPLGEVSTLPITPQVDAEAGDLPDDQRLVLNVLRLSYTRAEDLAEVLEPFLGEGARYAVVEPANILILLDNSISMQRTMQLVRLFDTPEMTQQRVRLFEVENSVVDSLAQELDSIFRAFSLSEDESAVQFIPVNRINQLMVVSSNPKIFGDVERWIEKLDVATTVGGVRNYVYQVQYGTADQLAFTLMQLYGTQPAFGFGGGGFGQGGFGGGGFGQGGFGGGGFGQGGFGGGRFGGGGFGGGRGGFGGGRGGFGGGGFGQGGFGGGGFIQLPQQVIERPEAATQEGAPADQTGALLGQAGEPGQQQQRGIRIVPDVINNLIVVQSTPQEWEIIKRTLEQLDFPPRQVRIDAKIYEVNLTDALSAGVEAFLRQRTDTDRKVTGSFGNGNINLNFGALVGQTRELFAFLEASASDGRTRVISAPSVIATDNIAATITVGTSIATLASQGLTQGAQADGTSLFTNTVRNVQTGVTLSILPRVNPSGIVTMEISQDVSSPLPPTGPVQSPSIDRRNITTQVTVRDGSTVAIGGIMTENRIFSRNRVPLIGKIPYFGGLFGTTSLSKSKTELIILLTPRIIYDENELVTATEELKGRLRSLRRFLRD